MSGKIFIGNAASSLTEADKLLPYSKVTVTDGTNSYTSGDSSGRELTVNVPLLPSGDGATLAANILAAVKNYRYQPYEAAGALLDPAAELGDGVTVGGIYGGIHAKTTTFSRLFRATVSAPAEEEIDNEYPYLSAQERDAVRQKKQTAQNTADIAGNTADIGTLNTTVANINDLVAKKASISSLNTAVARIDSLESEVGSFGTVYAKTADVKTLVANEVSAETASFNSLFTNSGYAGSIHVKYGVYASTIYMGEYAYKGGYIRYQDWDGNKKSMMVLYGQTG